MKQALKIIYWIVAIILLAIIFTSLGYRLAESVFIGTLFLPGAIIIRFFFNRTSLKGNKQNIINALFVIIRVVLLEIFLFFVANLIMAEIRNLGKFFYNWPQLPEILINPIFILAILLMLYMGKWFFDKWLDDKFPSGPQDITFLSDRKKVSLKTGEIMYVESNDSVTIVYATNDRTFRNKTPISQWESILEDDFIRIHRSYVVNKSYITSVEADAVFLNEIELPVSRKYCKSVRQQIKGVD